MSDVFISYHRDETDVAQRVKQALELDGWTVWWDREVPAGLTWSDMIERQLSEARTVLVLWSPRSVGSEWVREEAEYAREQGTLIPVKIREARIPLAFRGIQTFDLTDWDGRPEHPSFRRLTDAIRRLA